VWLTLEELLDGAYFQAKSDKEIENSDIEDITIHNALNYKTFHTGDGFDPHGLGVSYLGKKIYLLDEEPLKFDEFKGYFRVNFSDYGVMGKKFFQVGKGDDLEV